MAATLTAAMTDRVLDWLMRPMSVREFAAASIALLLAGSAYCQLYCAIAYQPMHPMPMPLQVSVAWAAGALLPWLVCLEVAKPGRALARSAITRTIGLSIVFAAAAGMSIILELGLDQLIGATPTRPLPMQLAAQLPGAAVTAILLWLGARLEQKIPTSVDHDREPLGEMVASASKIRWIEAAGNYVEIHSNDGVSLHRTTMQEMERKLDRSRFRRIHRSTIVNMDAVECRVLIRGQEGLRLADGTILKIGDRYRSNTA